MLRLPAGLKDHLSELALANGRSVNAQVIALLESAIELEAKEREVPERVEYLEAQVSELWQSIEELQRSVGSMHRTGG